MFPSCAFWDFSLRLYARPGVAEACLRLQGRHGIDVNLLFCCLWLGMEGKRISRRDTARMIARVRRLHEQVVKPLRTARTALKAMLGAEDPALSPALGVLRAAIKKSELDAEHLEQVVLAGLQPARGTAPAGVALAEANAAAYFAAVDVRLGRGDRADLAAILAALDTAKPLQSGEIAGAGEAWP